MKQNNIDIDHVTLKDLALRRHSVVSEVEGVRHSLDVEWRKYWRYHGTAKYRVGDRVVPLHWVPSFVGAGAGLGAHTKLRLRAQHPLYTLYMYIM